MAKLKKATKDTPIRERSEEAWDKSYDSYMAKRQEYLEKDLALEEPMSREFFKQMYSANYALHRKDMMRALVEGEIRISYKQGKVYAKGFQESKITEWIKQARKEGLIISEENEKLLQQLPQTDPKKFRSPQFMAVYDQLYPFIEAYNNSALKRNLFTEVINLGGSPKKRKRKR